MHVSCFQGSLNSVWLVVFICASDHPFEVRQASDMEGPAKLKTAVGPALQRYRLSNN